MRPGKLSVIDVINQPNELSVEATTPVEMKAVVGGLSRETVDGVLVAS